MKVLIVDDEKNAADVTAETLEKSGYHCITAHSVKEGKRCIDEIEPEVIITDLVMKDGDGMDILRYARKNLPDSEVIMVTGFGSVETAVAAMKEGAATYLRKPLNFVELRAVTDRASEKVRLARDNAALHSRLDSKFGFHQIIGNSPRMQQVFDLMRHVSATNATVLVTGESGTGKELVASAIHANSNRRRGPFVALNCAALSEGVLESELFGHEKGAFTGAAGRREGRFEYADGGTLFLDEVGDIPTTTQVKLLRVIESREIMRVGSNTPVPVNVRLIAATNQDLEALVAKKRFREDLYYRLKVVTVHLPLLRERAEDIPLMVQAFVREFAANHQKPVDEIEPAVFPVLQAYRWPGNVRELKNCVESMVVIARDRKLTLNDVPANIAGASSDSAQAGIGLPANLSLIENEKRLIKAALDRSGGNRKDAADMLHIGLRTLYRKIKEYGME
jgi:two-component system response regulator HydG